MVRTQLSFRQRAQWILKVGVLIGILVGLIFGLLGAPFLGPAVIGSWTLNGFLIALCVTVPFCLALVTTYKYQLDLLYAGITTVVLYFFILPFVFGSGVNLDNLVGFTLFSVFFSFIYNMGKVLVARVELEDHLVEWTPY